jgi:sugar/nucleoside kinase (ribokinase family)
MKKGIAVAGNIILDVLKPLSGFPVRHELVKVLEKSFSLGGLVSNVARDLARLDPDLPIEAVGAIGLDGEGDLIVKELSSYKNISLTHVKREGQTSFTDVLYEPETKARTFLVFGGAGDCFDVQDVPLDDLNCAILHAGYILLLPALDAPDPEYGTRMARLLHDAQKRGILTSVDVVSEVGDRYRTLVPPALRYTDYFIVNEIEAGKTVGVALRGPDEKLLVDRIPEVLMKLKALGVKRWAVIHAPEGGFGIDEKGQYVEIPSLQLPKGFIQGTVGAGDAFCSGVLLAAHNGEALAQAIDDGVAAAACSLRSAGASEGVTPLAEARALAASLPRQRLRG